MDATLTNALHIMPGHSSAGSVEMALQLPRTGVIPNIDPRACGPARGGRTGDLVGNPLRGHSCQIGIRW